VLSGVYRKGVIVWQQIISECSLPYYQQVADDKGYTLKIIGTAGEYFRAPESLRGQTIGEGEIAISLGVEIKGLSITSAVVELYQQSLGINVQTESFIATNA